MGGSLLKRARSVKEKLITFAKTQYKDAYDSGLRQLYQSKALPPSEEAILAYTDWFALEYQGSEHRTILQHFIEQAQDDADILVASQWKHVIHGIFQVKEVQQGRIFKLFNLVNEVAYQVTSTGTEPLPLQTGEYIAAKIIPLENYHLFSGIIDKIDTPKKEELYQLVSEIQLQNPKMAFIDNLQRLEQAYKIQEEEYQDFKTFFGSDEILLKGSELSQKLREFYHYRFYQKKKNQASNTIAKTFQEKYHQLPQIPTFEFLPDIQQADDIGILYDRIEGMTFLLHYGKFLAVFAQPELMQQPFYRQLLMGYLEDTAISSLPFRRVIAANPAEAVQVFKTLLKRRRFSLEKDFPKLMERYKPDDHLKHLTPAIIPSLVKSKTFLKSLKVNKNAPCPCGSGKKYRLCCGAL